MGLCVYWFDVVFPRSAFCLSEIHAKFCEVFSFYAALRTTCERLTLLYLDMVNMNEMRFKTPALVAPLPKTS